MLRLSWNPITLGRAVRITFRTSWATAPGVIVCFRLRLAIRNPGDVRSAFSAAFVGAATRTPLTTIATVSRTRRITFMATACAAPMTLR